MIDERYLADPGRCPACAALLRGGRDACPACELPLSGPTATRLWQVSVEVSRLLRERAGLVAALRAESAVRSYAGEPASGGGTVFAPAGPAGVPAAPTGPPPPGRRAEWTPRRMQNLLLALGVGLLGVAAVIFLVVSWGRLGVGGRAAVMTGVTALAAGGAYRASRRGLTATAEATSLLAVGLALLDCLGAWSSDLAGLRSVDGPVVAAGSTALVATLSGLLSHVLRTRSLRLSAAVLAQLPVPLLAGHLAETAAQPAALLAAAAAAQAVAALALVAGWPGRPDTRDARLVAGLGAGLAGVAATGLALMAAYAEDGSLVIGTVLLLVVTGVLALAAELLGGGGGRSGPAAASALRGVATAVLVAAGWAPLVDATPGRWQSPVLALAAATLLLLARLVPAGRRSAPAWVLLAATWLTALTALPTLLLAVAGRLQWPEDAWLARAAGGSPASWSSPARDLLRVPYLGDDVFLVEAPAPHALVLLVAALAACAAPLVRTGLHRPGRRLVAAAPPAALAAGLLAPLGLDSSYALGLASDVALATASLLGGLWALRRGRRLVAAAAVTSGLVALGLAVAWSFAVAVATLAVLPAAAAVLATAAGAAPGLPALRAARVLVAAAAAVLGVAEGAAVTRYTGAGWPAVWSVALTLLLASAVAAAALVPARLSPDPFWSGVRRAAVAVAVVAALADAAALTWWRGAGVAGVGLALAVAAALLLAASTVDLPARVVPEAADLRTAAVLAATVGTLGSALDGDRLWLALLAVGAGVAVLGVRVDHRAGWVAGLLLAASSWVRLALSDVTAPEAYTVPPALALLVVGWRRRARDPEYRSWGAYGPGLTLALGPSLLRAVTDAGNLRPLLLGLAALAVLGVGVARRLQAPLVLGAGVLAVDGLVQLAPTLAAVYDVVPRWVTIGTVGLLLLGAGATYEERVSDLRRVGRRVARLH